MSKLYQLNRMMYAPAAGGGVGTLIGKGLKWIGGLFGKKTKQVLVETALPAAKKIAPYVAAPLAYAGIEALSGSGPGTQSRGASGGWGYRRRRGITATELRGYRKVANLIHKEGMVSRRARGRSHS